MTKSKVIVDYFNELLPNAHCELNYNKDYELLLAVMLSAQTTDKAVNKVTNVLFKKYPTLEMLAKCSIEDIEQIIKPIGLYHNKAKNISQISKDLLNKFQGGVPDTKKELLTLKGIGNKTANVVLCELFSQNEFPVDTHIERVAKRLKLVNQDASVIEVERKLRKTFFKKDYIRLHHQFIHFGRYYCLAKKPKCENCKLKKFCFSK